MSRLRRRETHSRFFFITTNLLREQRPFNNREYEMLATALNPTRQRLSFALCGYCFMPDHIHLIIFPEESTTISAVNQRLSGTSSLRRLGLAGRPVARSWAGKTIIPPSEQRTPHPARSADCCPYAKPAPPHGRIVFQPAPAEPRRQRRGWASASPSVRSQTNLRRRIPPHPNHLAKPVART